MEKKAGVYFRIIHRYLGFYLVGIMAVYSVSGITLIFRRTDTFKKVTEVKTQLTPNLNENKLGKNLPIIDSFPKSVADGTSNTLSSLQNSPG